VTRNADVQGQEKVDVLAKTESKLTFLSPFILFRPLVDWMIPTHIGKGRSSVPSLFIQMLIYSVNTLTGTQRNNV
jgi:hypothetical protein